MNDCKESIPDRSDFEISIRQATINDLSMVMEYNVDLASETEGKLLELGRLKRGIEAVLQNPENGFYLIAENCASGQVAGQMLITYEWSDWRNGVFWWLQSVYVQKSCRRRGVFRRLYNHVMKEAQSHQKVVGLRLYVEKENHLAQQVYQELGLLPSGYHVYELDFVLSSESK